jgi:hypothetical protein
MNEYASEVANLVKFVVEGEWVDASSDAPIDVISPSTDGWPGRTRSRRTRLGSGRHVETRWMSCPASLGRGVLH